MNRQRRPLNRRIAALGLGLLATCVALARAQEEPPTAEAITRIEENGGRVEHQDLDPEKPVISIYFATQPIGDEALEPLGAFPDLEKLTLNNTQVTDAGLEHLQSLGKLEKLYLVDTSITDAGLEHLGALPSLEVLSLVGTKVTDAGLEHLEAIESLRQVFLAGTGVTDEGVKGLQDARPMLEIIR